MIAKARHPAVQSPTVRLRLWVDVALICVAVGFGVIVPIGSYFDPFGFRYSVPGHTGSMEPAINSASLLISRRADPGGLRVRDIIIFTRQSDGKEIVHRIVGIREGAGNKRGFTTKGDANAEPDVPDFTVDDYTYRVVAIIPFVGATAVLGSALVMMVSLCALAVRLAIRIYARRRMSSGLVGQSGAGRAPRSWM